MPRRKRSIRLRWSRGPALRDGVSGWGIAAKRLRRAQNLIHRMAHPPFAHSLHLFAAISDLRGGFRWMATDLSTFQQGTSRRRDTLVPQRGIAVLGRRTSGARIQPPSPRRIHFGRGSIPIRRDAEVPRLPSFAPLPVLEIPRSPVSASVSIESIGGIPWRASCSMAFPSTPPFFSLRARQGTPSYAGRISIRQHVGNRRTPLPSEKPSPASAPDRPERIPRGWARQGSRIAGHHEGRKSFDPCTGLK